MEASNRCNANPDGLTPIPIRNAADKKVQITLAEAEAIVRGIQKDLR